MAVLLILVLLLSRVFGVAANTWRNGNKRIESNNSARAALEFMSRELSGVIMSSGRPTMRLDSDEDRYLGMDSDRLSFVSLEHQAEYRGSTPYRDVQLVRYFVAPMPTNLTAGATNRLALYRMVTESWDSPSFDAYGGEDWLDNFDARVDNIKKGLNDFAVNVLADNVRNFEVFITPLGDDTPLADYDALSDPPAAAIDIYLEVLAEDDAIRASMKPGDTDFINAATRRYATRIYVQNRAGYENW